MRGMTWFLFGRFGTPALLSVLARDTITRSEPMTDMPKMPEGGLWQAPITALKAQTEWFKKESRHMFELLSLPVLQLLAAAINFPVVVIRSRPAFTLPFSSLDEVLTVAPRWSGTHKAVPEGKAGFQTGGAQ